MEVVVSAIPGLSEAQIERLAWLMEECAEVVHIVGKIIRHGYSSHHPKDPEGPDNRLQLAHELGDLFAAIGLMVYYEDFDQDVMAQRTPEKLGRVGQYLHHNEITPELLAIAMEELG